MKWMAAVLLGMLALGAAIADQPAKQTIKFEHKLLDNSDELLALGCPGMGGGSLSEKRIGESAKWPTFKCPKPLYGILIPGEYGMGSGEDGDSEGYLLAADQSGAVAGLYDILYIDLDKDGRLSETERFTGKPVDFSGEAAAGFGGIALPGKDAAHVAIWVVASEGSSEAEGEPTLSGYIYSCCGCCLEGTAQIEGKDQKLRLFDLNSNGRFDDAGVDAIALGGTGATTIGVTLLCAGKPYTASIVGATSLDLSPYDGPTGRLIFKPVTDSTTPVGVSGMLLDKDENEIPFDDSAGAGLTLPVGSYTVVSADLKTKVGDIIWSATLSLDKPLEVEAGKDAVLSFGKPLVLQAQATGSPRPGNDMSIAYTLRGEAGETYSALATEKGSEADAEDVVAKVKIKDATGNVLDEAVMEPG